MRDKARPSCVKSLGPEVECAVALTLTDPLIEATHGRRI